MSFFCTTTRRPKESISDYADRYCSQWANLQAHAKVLPEKDVVTAFTNGLGDDFKLLQDYSTFGLNESKLLEPSFESCMEQAIFMTASITSVTLTPENLKKPTPSGDNTADDTFRAKILER